MIRWFHGIIWRKVSKKNALIKRKGHKKRMSNEDKSLTITHSPLSSAVWTGLEPATPCVTGRYSNRLNYHTKILRFCL